MIEEYQIFSGAITDRGLNERRVQNEDSYLELPEYGIFAVADGVGGAQAGEVASKMAIEILAEAFVNLKSHDDAEEIMKEAIKKANAAVYQMSKELPQLSSMATTIVALHVKNNIATIGHVGDSRLYRLDPRGNFFRETQDHSVVEEEVRAGRMTLAQAANHPSRNVISRAIGAERDVDIDLKTIMIEPNTTFLLCSDGVTCHIEDYELRELLLDNSDPKQVCEKIKQICYRRGAEDNLTAIVVKVAVQKQAADEEETISSAKTASADSSSLELATQELKVSSATTNSEQHNESPEKEAISSDKSSSVRIEKQPVDQVSEPISEQKTSVLSKIFWSLLLVALGVILGAVIYHFALLRYGKLEVNTARSDLPPSDLPPSDMPRPSLESTEKVEIPNIEYVSFEDNRRNVDKDPNRYIELSRGQAETPEDFYLLGRAYFLTGKYLQAKEAFEKAKTQLDKAKQVNKPTLETELAIGLAIVENAIARREFINQKSLMTGISNSESNVSTQVPRNGQ